MSDSKIAHEGHELLLSFWTAPAERSGDGAFVLGKGANIRKPFSQSGVALRLPQQSKTLRLLGRGDEIQCSRHFARRINLNNF
jgi:hypothetical protein